MAHGDSVAALSKKYLRSESTIRTVLITTCKVIRAILEQRYLTEPSTNQYETIATRFMEKTGIPNVIGAFGAKHIRIIEPPHEKYALTVFDSFCNKRNYYSLILFAACDADCRFTLVSIGGYGSDTDDQALGRSSFGELIYQGGLGIPEPKPLPGTDQILPHFFLGNSALELHEHIMRPYNGCDLSEDQIKTNKKLLEARSVIDRSFGILTTEWRVLQTCIEFEPKDVQQIAVSCVILHNHLRRRFPNRHDNVEFATSHTDPSQRQENRSKVKDRMNRDRLSEFLLRNAN